MNDISFVTGNYETANGKFIAYPVFASSKIYVDDSHCINHLSRAVSWSVGLLVSSRSHPWFVLVLPGRSCVSLSTGGGPTGNRHLLSRSLGGVGVKIVLEVDDSGLSYQVTSAWGLFLWSWGLDVASLVGVENNIPTRRIGDPRIAAADRVM